MEQLDNHPGIVAKALLDGRAVPVLGAGVNRSGPHGAKDWRKSRRPPDGTELAESLAFELQQPDLAAKGLLAVSQYLDLQVGWDPLYRHLRSIFGREHDATPVHTFLARLARHARDHDGTYPLILTTNYDNVLEGAFEEIDEPYDLLTYIATPNRQERGLFKHTRPNGDSTVITTPNKYQLDRDERAVIVKIHGGIGTTSDHNDDSYVITEDHYIDYMARNDVANQLPVHIRAILNFSHILFLGYSLGDWNLRVFFRRIWGADGNFSRVHWAVQLRPTPFDVRFWQRQAVNIVDVDLAEYVSRLTDRLEQTVSEAA